MVANAYEQAIELGSDPRECVCLNFRQASRVLTQKFDDALKPTGLTITQFSMLMPLEGKGPMRISELADFQVIERTTLTRNLSVMEREGLVKIVPGDDKRTRVVQITGKGRKCMQAAVPIWNEMHQSVLSQLGNSNWDGMRGEVQDLIRTLR